MKCYRDSSNCNLIRDYKITRQNRNKLLHCRTKEGLQWQKSALQKTKNEIILYERRAWKFVEQMLIEKVTFNETYSVHFHKNEAVHKKFSFYNFYLFLYRIISWCCWLFVLGKFYSLLFQDTFCISISKA